MPRFCAGHTWASAIFASRVVKRTTHARGGPKTTQAGSDAVGALFICGSVVFCSFVCAPAKESCHEFDCTVNVLFNKFITYLKIVIYYLKKTHKRKLKTVSLLPNINFLSSVRWRQAEDKNNIFIGTWLSCQEKAMRVRCIYTNVY